MATLDEHARRGIAALEEKRYDDAIEAFGQALAIEADRPDMNNAMAMAHLHRGDTGNAIPYLERAVELAEPFDHSGHQPMKREFHLTLAAAYQVMDRVQDARRVLQGAMERWPEVPEPKLRLAQLLAVTGRLDAALDAWKGAFEQLDGEQKQAIEALVGAIEAWRASEHDASVFLQGHQESYVEYFDHVAAAQAEHGWIAEAARMARGADGELVPIVAEGARPYALSRVDLVNPADGSVSSVYSDEEPMIVGLNGLEPLAQVPVLLPWEGFPFEALVCSQCPWHWLQITVQFEAEADAETRIEWLDELVGGWYLAGWNGEFGSNDAGRFHYIGDPEEVGPRALSYVVDLGRARYDAVGALLNRLVVLHDRHPIRRVIFGQGRLAD